MDARFKRCRAIDVGFSQPMIDGVLRQDGRRPQRPGDQDLRRRLPRTRRIGNASRRRARHDAGRGRRRRSTRSRRCRSWSSRSTAPPRARYGINVGRHRRPHPDRHRRRRRRPDLSSATAATTSPSASRPARGARSTRSATCRSPRRAARRSRFRGRHDPLQIRREHHHPRDGPSPPDGEARLPRPRPRLLPGRCAAQHRQPRSSSTIRPIVSNGAASSRTSSGPRRGWA